MKTLLLGATAALAFSATAANAVVVQWADLTSQTDTTVSGAIDVNGSSVGVTYAGGYYAPATQINGGINYWIEGNPKPYTGGTVENAPPTTDIIAFSAGGLKTITFDRTVSDVYLALVSWNGNAGVFDQPFEVISQGCGYWGCGTFENVTATSFTGNGELHGIIRFTGSFNSVSFTDRGEEWHGIQIGIAGIAPPQGVPEPATWAMMIGGFGLAGAAMRRRATKVSFA